MKKINLNKLFAELTKKFGANRFSVDHILPKDGIPIDVMIDAYPSDIKSIDLKKIETIVKKCITGKVTQMTVSKTRTSIHIYIEF